jgi:hypothetical protein
MLLITDRTSEPAGRPSYRSDGRCFARDAVDLSCAVLVDSRRPIRRWYATPPPRHGTLPLARFSDGPAFATPCEQTGSQT